jgi:TolA-binding protein
MTRVPFFEQLRTEQDRLREQAGFLQRAQVRQALALPRARAKPRRWTGWLLAAGACAVLVAGLVLYRPAASEPLAFMMGDDQRGHAGAFVAAPADRQLPLRFADGTRIALTPGSSARIASLDSQGAHLVIEKGRALAAVVHRPDSRWRIDVGPFQVAVIGTRFDVSWDVAARVMELKLEEGAVRVSGGLLSEALEVRAGQRLRAFADDARVELSLSDAPERDPSGQASAVSEATPETATPPLAPPMVPLAEASAAPVGVGAPAWRKLAAAGKFREALAAAEQAGFEAECARASGNDLLALGDAARLSGSPSRAEQAYSAAHGKLPGGGRASYGLGLVAFDQRGDFLGASRHFETYLREQPSGALRAEATGRLMEAWQRAGRLGEARRVAEQYVGRYPQGPQAARAKQLLQ